MKTTSKWVGTFFEYILLQRYSTTSSSIEPFSVFLDISEFFTEHSSFEKCVGFHFHPRYTRMGAAECPVGPRGSLSQKPAPFVGALPMPHNPEPRDSTTTARNAKSITSQGPLKARRTSGGAGRCRRSKGRDLPLVEYHSLIYILHLPSVFSLFRITKPCSFRVRYFLSSADYPRTRFEIYQV